MPTVMQDDKAMKVVWGKDATRREAKVRLSYRVPSNIDEFIAEAGSDEKAIDAIHDYYKIKARGRVRGKLVTYKSGENPADVSKELLSLAQESPFVSLRPRSEAFRVKSALETIKERALAGEISTDDILAIIKAAKLEESGE